MKRLCVVLIAGTVLIGTGVPYATAQEVQPKRKAPLELEATLEDWLEFGAELAELETNLATFHSAVISGVAEWRFEECRFQSLHSVIWTQREERLTAKCATDIWQVPGGLAKFMSEGFCESGYYRLAYNPNGHVGLYQHDSGSYTSRLRSAQPRHWNMKLPTDWRNSRGHIVMTAVYVNRYGWGAWDSYNSC